MTIELVSPKSGLVEVIASRLVPRDGDYSRHWVVFPEKRPAYYLRKALAEREIDIQVTEEAKRYLAEKGYDPVYGARPLKRTIQRELQDPLALRLLQGDFREGDTVRVGSNGEALPLERIATPAPVAAS